MSLRVVVCCLGLVFGLLPAVSVADEPAGGTRPLRVDDFLNTEELGTPVFSPDGQALAFPHRRAATSQVTNGLLIPENRDDIWVQRAPGQQVRNLTNGARDRSGWWSPKWSPDGRHLLFLSSRGGNVTAWLWARRTDVIRQLSTDGIEFEGSTAGCQWVDPRRVICLAMPEGERSAPVGSDHRSGGRAVARATAAWERAARSGSLRADWC
jgi:hypothetical protein